MNRVRRFLVNYPVIVMMSISAIATALFLALGCAISGTVHGAEPDDEAARAAVAVEVAKLRLQKSAPVVPISPKPAHRFTATDGITYQLHEDGFYRPVAGAPVVAPSSFRGGCGCTASANCGASFCKSRGGTGCPASCPVKGSR